MVLSKRSPLFKDTNGTLTKELYSGKASLLGQKVKHDVISAEYKVTGNVSRYEEKKQPTEIPMHCLTVLTFNSH